MFLPTSWFLPPHGTIMELQLHGTIMSTDMLNRSIRQIPNCTILDPTVAPKSDCIHKEMIFSSPLEHYLWVRWMRSVELRKWWWCVAKKAHTPLPCLSLSTYTPLDTRGTMTASSWLLRPKRQIYLPCLVVHVPMQWNWSPVIRHRITESGKLCAS